MRDLAQLAADDSIFFFLVALAWLYACHLSDRGSDDDDDDDAWPPPGVSA
jgi:hypothetical protein